MRRLIVAVAILGVGLWAACEAQAQTNPHDGPVPPAKWCEPWIPYNADPMPASCREEASSVIVIPEGVVHAPGSEYAFLVVVPVDQRGSKVLVKFVVQGGEPIYRWANVAPNGRLSVEAHLMYPTLTTFSTIVYCERECAAQLVSRSAANFWAPVQPQSLRLQ